MKIYNFNQFLKENLQNETNDNIIYQRLEKYKINVTNFLENNII